MSRRTSLAPSSISTSRQSSLAYKGCSEPMNDAALQFKLSKKVAELTLVVHMLFTRNHEREVELEATKEAYEQEIDNISAEFEKQIALLKKEIDSEKSGRKAELDKMNREGDEITRKLIEKHAKKISDLTAENDTLRSNLKALEERNKRLVEELARSEREQDSLGKERIAKERAMEKDQQKIEKLQQNARANKELMDKMKDNIHSIQKGVNQKITQMEASSRSATEIAEQLKLQNDHLESENKSLKKKLSDQASQLRKFESGITTNGGTSTPASKSKSSAKTIDKGGSKEYEIESLKREVQRYRMELKNREENFNKIFSEIKPVMVTTGEGDLCCVKEIRDDVLDPEKTEELYGRPRSINTWRARKILTPF